MVASTAAGASYSVFAALVYTFNLIVGTGALAAPAAFADAGLIMSICVLSWLGFLAYVTVTYVIEVLAAANALRVFESSKASVESGTGGIPMRDTDASPLDRLLDASDVEDTPRYAGGSTLVGDEDEDVDETTRLQTESRTQLARVASPFRIKERIELGLMAQMFIGRKGVYFFYAVMIAYLYGDLCIYAIAVPVSLAKVTGGFSVGSLDVHDPYVFYIILFAAVVVPFCFSDIQGTTWFQYVTLFTRNSAFAMMIVIAAIYVGEGNGAKARDLPMAKPAKLPSLFGTFVYSFMCHHTLPSIVTPIRNKKSLFKLFAADYVFVWMAYLSLCITALFAFGSVTEEDCSKGPGAPCRLQQLYTMNFQSYDVRGISYYLMLFPVFTLSSNFPMIAITLRNNIATLYDMIQEDRAAAAAAAQPDLVPINQPVSDSAPEPERGSLVGLQTRDWRAWARKNAFALLAVGPPIGVAFLTRDVDALVSVTGSFAGLFIQYVIPTVLVWYCRHDPRISSVKEGYGPVGITPVAGDRDPATPDPFRVSRFTNMHASPFRSRYWVYLLGVWSVVAFFLSAANLIIGWVD